MPYPILKNEQYTNFGGINDKVSSYLTGVNELLSLQNGDFTKVGSITTVPGTSLYLGATLTTRITGIWEYDKLSGASYQIVSADTNVYKINGGAYSSIRSGLTNNLLFDFVTFVDWLFACNGAEIFKFDGVNSYNFSLPPGTTPTITPGVSNGTGFTGAVQYAYGYLNNRGYYGPAINLGTFAGTGATQITVSGFTAPTGYGISAIILYRSEADSSNLFQYTSLSPSATSYVDTGSTAITLGTRAAPTNLFFTMAPTFMEIYNNQVFYAGFSSALSTAYFSDIGEPEAIGSTAFIECRTNDGDKLTNLKTYQTSLMFFKQYSFHQLTGGDPTQFSLDEKSTNYGCLNNRCATTWEDYIWFLDSKGIVEFNGSNTTIVSQKVEYIFKRMNLDAARRNAWMAYDKRRNEVLCSIPVDDSEVNNLIVIYDTVAKAWRTDNGISAISFGIMQASFSVETAFYGGYSGLLEFQGIPEFTRQGQNCTLVIKTGFFAPQGHSVQDVFRRLFLDVELTPGITLPILVRFYINQGITTPVLERTMYMGQTFQLREDFGLSAKDMALEFIYSGSYPLRFNGFTVGRRYQRDV